MKKKIIIIVAAVIVLAGAIFATVKFGSSLFKGGNGSEKTDTPSSSQTTGVAGTISIEVGSAEAEADSIVKVPVTVKENCGFVASLMTFTYDNTVLKFMGYEKGDVIKDYQFDTADNTIKFLNCENEDTDKNGTLFTLKFKVTGKAGAKSDVKLDVNEIVNYDEKDIESVVTSGTVTVK